jgi:hypothetical protein
MITCRYCGEKIVPDTREGWLLDIHQPAGVFKRVWGRTGGIFGWMHAPKTAKARHCDYWAEARPNWRRALRGRRERIGRVSA